MISMKMLNGYAVQLAQSLFTEKKWLIFYFILSPMLK